MPLRSLARSWLCCLTLLLAAAGASAEEPASAESPGSDAAALAPDSAYAPDFGDERGFVGRREMRPFGRLGFFAAGQEHGFDPRTSTFDLEGGATLALVGSLSLSGGYRLLDYEFTPGDANLSSQYRGAFVSLSLDF